MFQKFGCVGIQIIAADLALMIGLARRFKRDHGSYIVLYVRSENEVTGLQYLVREGVANEIVNCEKIMPILQNMVTDPTRLFERARTWEECLGETITQLTF